MSDPTGQRGVARRQVVTGVVSAAVALPVLAACGGGSGGKASGAATRPAGPGTKLGSVADVPVGGGQVFPDQRVVVTQPAEGVWKGFSAVCTHNQCLVNQIADGTITCPCHLSKFSVSDGSVQSGPAPKPLPEVEVDVKDGQATVA